MPQIVRTDIDSFIDTIEAEGVSVTPGVRAVGKLLPTQVELNLDKVDGFVQKFKEQKPTDLKPFIVSSDGRIMDGHHKWAALKAVAPELRVACLNVNLPMVELLKLAKAFGKTDFKGIGEGTLDFKDLRSIIREAVDANTKNPAVAQAKINQEKEKENLITKQRLEIEKARQQDFENAERQRKEDQIKKDAEAASKKAAKVNEEFSKEFV